MREPNLRLAQIHLDCLSGEFNRVPGVRAICRISDPLDAIVVCSICFLAPETFVASLRESLHVAQMDGSLELTWMVETAPAAHGRVTYVLRPTSSASCGVNCVTETLVSDLTMLRRLFTGDRATDLSQLAARVFQAS